MATITIDGLVALDPGEVFVKSSSHRARREVERRLGGLPQTFYTLERRVPAAASYFVLKKGDFAKVEGIKGVSKARFRKQDAWQPTVSLMLRNPEEVDATKDRLMQMRPRRGRNPVRRRLEWVADRYPLVILALTMAALAEARGHHVLRNQLTSTVAPALRMQATWIGDPHHGFAARDARAHLFSWTQHLPQHTPYDRYLPWVARELSRAPYAGDQVERIINGFQAVANWAAAEHVDLNRLGFNTAFERATRWAEQRKITAMLPGEVVYTFPDGWTVQELRTGPQLVGESGVMQHCVDQYAAPDEPGGYILDLEGEPVRIFSLRDPRGQPHATMELGLGEPHAEVVRQLRGKQNAPPAAPYLWRMVEFRQKRFPGFRVKRVKAPDYAAELDVPLVGAYRIDLGRGLLPTVHLLYRDGTLLFPEDLAAAVAGANEVASERWPHDVGARLRFVHDTMAATSPGQLNYQDEPLEWLHWAAVMEGGPKAAFSSDEDEMVRWIHRQYGIDQLK